MPPDTREREKIIGGIFDLRQFFWIALGVGLYALVGWIFYKLFSFFILILALPIPVMGFVFALKKVEDIPLPTYLKLKYRYKKKIKYYINYGTHKTLEFEAPRVTNTDRRFRKKLWYRR